MRLNKTYLNPQKRTFDIPLILVVSMLVIFGLVSVYDASVIQAYRDFGDSFYYIRWQLIWMVLGVLVAIFFANFDYHKLRSISFLALAGSVLLLLAVFIPGIGTSAGGAHRWLNLNFLTIQPAEVFKLSAVLWLSAIFDKGARLKPLLGLILIVGFIMGFLQKDLGSTAVFVATSLGLYIIAGGSLWRIVLSLPVAVAAFLLLVIFSEYRRKRVLAFLDPFSDPQGFSYHISQILIALGTGGLFGLGLGQSRQKYYLPEVTTDSIFAVIGEELGFLGSMLLIALFIALVIRGFKIADKTTDQFGKILASGLTLWLGIQAIVNLGAISSLLPLTGVPLPFISYGGSALVVNLAAIGILFNISKQT